MKDAEGDEMTRVINKINGACHENNHSEKRKQDTVSSPVWKKVIGSFKKINGFTIDDGYAVDVVNGTLAAWQEAYPGAFRRERFVNGARHVYEPHGMVWTYYHGSNQLVYRFTPRR